MSERSLYPNNVEVKQANLEYTEATKGEQDRKRLLDSQGANAPAGGRVSGLTLSVTGAATTFRVAAGRGYTPNGELVELDALSSGNNLSDETLGVVNNVYLAYTEIETSPQPHETDGTTRNTRAEAVTTPVALTQAEFDALPASDSDYTNNAQDRLLKIGEITGAGVGVNIPSANVSQQPLPPAPSTLIGVRYSGNDYVPGVNVSTVAQDTPTGTGQLTLTRAAGVNTLTWTSPAAGDSDGAGVAVTSTSVVTVTSALGYEIDVRTQRERLPRGADQVYAEDVLVEVIYNDTGEPIITQRDLEHRDAAILSERSTLNPHGVPIHESGQAFSRVRNLTVTDDADTIPGDQDPRPILTLDAGAVVSDYKILIEQYNPQGGLGVGKRLMTGSAQAGSNRQRQGLHFGVNCYWDDVNEEWVPDDTNENAYLLDFGSENLSALQLRVQRDTSANWADGDWDDTYFTFTPNLTASPIPLLRLGKSVDSTSSGFVDRPLIQLDLPYVTGGNPRYTPILRLTDDDPAEDTIKGSLYRRTDGSTTTALMLVTGAEWNSGTLQWNQLSQADDPYPLRMRFEQLASQDTATAGIYFETGVAGPTFNEASWTTKLRIPPGTASVEIPDDLDIGGALAVGGAASADSLTVTNAASASQMTVTGADSYKFSSTVTAYRWLRCVQGSGGGFTMDEILLDGGVRLSAGETAYFVLENIPDRATAVAFFIPTNGSATFDWSFAGGTVPGTFGTPSPGNSGAGVSGGATVVLGTPTLIAQQFARHVFSISCVTGTDVEVAVRVTLEFDEVRY